MEDNGWRAVFMLQTYNFFRNARLELRFLLPQRAEDADGEMLMLDFFLTNRTREIAFPTDRNSAFRRPTYSVPTQNEPNGEAKRILLPSDSTPFVLQKTRFCMPKQARKESF